MEERLQVTDKRDPGPERTFSFGVSSFIQTLSCLFMAVLLTACFEQVPKGASTSLDSQGPAATIDATQFQGASEAINKVTGIEVRWSSATVPVAGYRIYRVSGRNLNLLASVASSLTAFIDGEAYAGSIYSYIVRAVDAEGLEDRNAKIVSALAWNGIASVEAISRSSIRVRFGATSTTIDEIRVYLLSTNGDKKLVATVNGSQDSVVISDLRTAFKYRIAAQAYVSTLGREDGNDVWKETTTLTQGYHDEGTSLAGWQNVSNVRAFGESPNAPVHPSDPLRSPRQRVVELQFRSFPGVSAERRYAVTRALVNQPIDTSVKTACLPTTESSCRACELSGVGVLTCRDDQVAASPARYRYTLSLIHTDTATGDEWTEQIPAEQLANFTVVVPIPPRDMVLVHRNAVNFEMCTQQMNAPVETRNNNRCLYNGVGGRPLNSGPGRAPLNLPSGYYDMGYSFFMDRYPQACNYTKAVNPDNPSNPGRCGPAGASGDCIGHDVPTNDIGINGNVFVELGNRADGLDPRTRCYLKIEGVWQQHTSLNTVASDVGDAYRSVITTDPGAMGGKRPEIGFNTTYTSHSSCISQVDPSYGPKRLPRMREYRAFATFPTVPGDLNFVTYNQAVTIMNGSSWNAATGFRCNRGTFTNSMRASSLAGLLAPAQELFQVQATTAPFPSLQMEYGHRRFVIGAVSNIDCQTRYGAQGVFDDLWTGTSDAFQIDVITKNLTGTASPVDSGNRDLVADTGGGQNGFILSYSNSPTNASNPRYNLFPTTNVGFIAAPLGMPIFAVSSTVYLPIPYLIENYGSIVLVPTLTETNASLRRVLVKDRWTSTMQQAVTTANTSTNRCVLPAD